MMQSFILMAVITVLWALVGYSLVFAEGTPLIGDLRYVFLRGVGIAPNPDYAATIPQETYMIYQLMFAIITPALIAGAFAEQFLYFGESADAAACSQRFAIQAGGSAGKVENTLQVPCVKNPVRKGGVEEIAGSRGVHHVDLKRGSIPEAATVPSERAVYAESRANGAKAVLALKLR